MSDITEVRPADSKLKMWVDQGYILMEPSFPYEYINWALAYLGSPLRVCRQSSPDLFLFEALFKASCKYLEENSVE